MPEIVEARKREPKKPKQEKICIKCGKTKPIDEFFLNKDWGEQLNHDCWCTQCVRACRTKDDIKEYVWYNNREWDERIWELAKKRAEKTLSTNDVYIKSNAERKAKILEKVTCSNYPGSMAPYYKYRDNTCGGKFATFEDAKKAGEVFVDQEEDEKQYSKEFNGEFTRKDLEYLEEYYAKLEEDFAFDNESIRDYARKVCKASLQADKAQNEYANGNVEFSTVKDALAQFDLLSKSANFAACQRKKNETGGLTSWSETTFKLETTGHTMQRKIEWEKDDVDRTIEELRHITRALNLDGM